MFKSAANVKGELTADAAPLANVLSVDDATFAYLNYLLAPGDWTYIKIGAAPACEIARVDGATGYTLQVARGFDGTSPTAFPSGTSIEYILSTAAIVDIITDNPTPAVGLAITGVSPIIVTQTAVNQFEVSSEALKLSSDGTIDILGTYPDLQLGVSRSANGCCG